MFYDTYGKGFFGVIWIPIADDKDLCYSAGERLFEYSELCAISKERLS